MLHTGSPFPPDSPAASVPRGSVAAGHGGDGGALGDRASACHLVCDAAVCLFLPGWNRIAPELTVTNGSGEGTPLRDGTGCALD